MTTNDVLFTTLATQDNNQLGQITLNRPKALNSLSTEMCRAILSQLEAWEADDSIKAVIIHGAGEKGFCAGGDVRALNTAKQNHDATGQDGEIVNGAYEFFTSEYAMDAKLHAFNKPVIVWGDGIVMGGGMGVFRAGSHRIVCETTKFAMPEVTIGLFPDATGSWFLQRYPADTGLFMGLTGAVGNAEDAIFTNVANYQASSGDFEKLLEALTQADWASASASQLSSKNSLSDDKTVQVNRPLHDVASKVISQFCKVSKSKSAFASSQLAQTWQPISELMNVGGLADIDAILQSDDKLIAWFERYDVAYANNDFLTRAIANYRHGCPVTVCLTHAIYQNVKAWSLADILDMETTIALHCVNNPDFSEGVRALLIDKDKSPNWSRTLAECLTQEGQAYIQSHFKTVC